MKAGFLAILPPIRPTGPFFSVQPYQSNRQEPQLNLLVDR